MKDRSYPPVDLLFPLVINRSSNHPSSSQYHRTTKHYRPNTFSNNNPIKGVPPKAPNPQIKNPTPILDPISLLLFANDMSAGAIILLNTPDEIP